MTILIRKMAKIGPRNPDGQKMAILDTHFSEKLYDEFSTNVYDTKTDGQYLS